jgi:hypothetical protein
LSVPMSDSDVKVVHEEFWRWVFRKEDGPNHPLKISDGGEAQIEHGSVLIVGGSLPDSIPKNRILKIPQDIEYIFIPAENCVYTEADGDGETDQELLDKANRDMMDSKARVSVNEAEQKIRRLSAHMFSSPLKVEQCISGAGNSGKGEGQGCIKNSAPGETRAAAACDCVIMSASSLKSQDIIKIEGIGRAGADKEPGRIDITYKVHK